MAHLPPIVGIGASAGGLEALQDFVQAVPNDTGVAYVVVQHLARDHPSLMDKLLGAHTRLSVSRIENGGEIEPDHVYVIPPGYFVEIEEGRFHLTDSTAEQGVRTPIDRFFTSMADAAGRHAFGVVLSGTGSDGTVGVRSIKANGGIALVQESRSARFPGMPDSAAATGVVDFVLRPEDMPSKILEIVHYRRRIEEGEGREALLDEIESRLQDVLECLDADSDHSFAGYKPGTLIRRVARRMTLLRQSTVSGYIETLRDRRDERSLLTQDFLIGVTQFFRDPEHHEAVRRRALTQLFESEQASFRIWVPGCSTGEEAYSLAIMVQEMAQERGDTRPWKIFGTDIDLDALRHARNGRYSEASMMELSDDRRDRFFVEDETGWQVRGAIREMCVFAPHNLLQDPPFSKLDLISCRNVMIYLNADSQNALMPRFHYALNPGGFLWLGPSESLGRQERFFSTIDRNARIFCRNDETAAGFSAISGRAASPRAAMPQAHEPPRMDSSSARNGIEQQAEQAFLTHSAPPFAAINRHDEVVYLSEGMTAMVRPTRGAVGTAIDDYLVQELRLPAHSILGEARENQSPAEVRNIVVEIDGKTRLYDLTARPFGEESDLLLLTLHEVRPRDLAEVTSVEGQGALNRGYERELALTRKRLTTLQHEYETTEQELRSTNEELLSMNEELQSSNEELETSREELQSINEELETINAELSENNRQLGRANSDLKNLLESTAIATLFIDQNDCVRLFTPELARLFGVQERDIGRSIHDLASKVEYPALREDAAQVLRTLQPVERELMVPATGETFHTRVRPYRTVDNRLDGVVITFVDVTSRKRHERQLEENARVLREQYAELETLYDSTPIGLNLVDRELRWLRINTRLAEINGFPVEEHIGRLQSELIPEVHEIVAPLQRQVFETGEPVLGLSVVGQTASHPGVTREWLCDFYPVRAGGEIFAVGCCVQDITEQRALERQVFESEARMRRIFDQAPVAISMHEGPEFVTTYSNPRNQFEVAERDILGKPISEAMPELIGSPLMERIARVFATGEASDEQRLDALLGDRAESGERSVYRNVLEPWFDPSGNVVGIISFSLDVTDQALAQERDDRHRQRLQRIQDSLAAYVGLLSNDGTLLEVNVAALERGGVTRDDVIGRKFWDTFWWSFNEESQDRLKEAVAAACAGESVRYDVPVRIEGGESMIIDFQLVPIVADDGTVTELVASAIDITERVHAVERKDVLLAELEHRVKNILATVQSIARFTARMSRSKEEMASSLLARLAAISRTHDALTAGDWRGQTLRELVAAEVAPYVGEDGGRFRYEGDNIHLSPGTALSLGLALHELATNAAKYGAFTSHGGSVELEVEAEGDSFSRIEWREQGGPPVEEPEHLGFGSFLIGTLLKRELKADIRVDYLKDGLKCTITKAETADSLSE
ncbi:chemotaxis protein CheB [Pseudoroseicyclus tamaricis]|uniref:histidine kinase n=1 Tax=Pseudoroseicyclus tamaricis TaxID=2705421 RepID=A0A6B2JQU0_9RHOB|nr:chemotaxis protein CheB [Pseudoroseicyclus tamaricis]NDV00335.1 PAS domain-containing protein [Pseudoroseicyclus tamaricis]